MNVQEFSSEFDILYNNIMSNQAPGLDEYEKSVFLTKAQYEILKNYFNPKGNKYNEGFDDNEKRQIDFSSIIKVVELTSYSGADYTKLDDRSSLYEFPDDLMFILNESVILNDQNILNIIPVDYREYSRLISRPFKYPLKNQGWRLFQSSQNSGPVSEIIVGLGMEISKYKLRYVRKPKPIILINLEEDYPDLSIDGEYGPLDCELDSSIHQEILERAVELAKSAYIGDLNSTVELGQRSE